MRPLTSWKPRKNRVTQSCQVRRNFSHRLLVLALFGFKPFCCHKCIWKSVFVFTDCISCTICPNNTPPDRPTIVSASNMSDDGQEIQEMLASFDVDSVVRTRVQSLNEEHILFSIYGNQVRGNRIYYLSNLSLFFYHRVSESINTRYSQGFLTSIIVQCPLFIVR